MLSATAVSRPALPQRIRAAPTHWPGAGACAAAPAVPAAHPTAAPPPAGLGRPRGRRHKGGLWWHGARRSGGPSASRDSSRAGGRLGLARRRVSATGAAGAAVGPAAALADKNDVLCTKVSIRHGGLTSGPISIVHPRSQGKWRLSAEQSLRNQRSGSEQWRPARLQASVQLWLRSAARGVRPSLGGSARWAGSRGQKRRSATSTRAPLHMRGGGRRGRNGLMAAHMRVAVRLQAGTAAVDACTGDSLPARSRTVGGPTPPINPHPQLPPRPA